MPIVFSGVGETALIYASDHYHEDLRFRVVGPDGYCFIGGSDECAVQDSTAEQRGGLASIEYNGVIYRVKYSGADSALERFSITSVDPIPTGWSITLESEDTFIPQAFALEDIKLKVKYRTISETVTVK